MKCVKCGAWLGEGDRVCPQCGAARELISGDFLDLQAKTEALMAARQSGAMTEDTYRSNLQALVLSDPAGVYWHYDPQSRTWSSFRNGAWENVFPSHLQAVSSPQSKNFPPASPPPGVPAPAAHPSSGNQTRNLNWILIGTLGAVLLILGYATFAWLLGGYHEARLQGEILEVGDGNNEVPGMMALTDSQRAMREYRGAPDAFLILFYQEEQEDGSLLDVRLETWTYYSADIECTFYNGELVGEERLLDHLENVLPTTYLPEHFLADMSAQQVAQTAGTDEYLLVPLDNELVEYGKVYYASGLSWGMKGNRLSFVQGLAFESEGTP